MKGKMMAKPKLQAVKTNGVEHPITGEVQPSEEEAQVRAVLQAQKEKKAREQACHKVVEQAMNDFNCNFAPMLKAGEQLIPPQNLITLPVVVTIVSR